MEGVQSIVGRRNAEVRYGHRRHGRRRHGRRREKDDQLVKRLVIVGVPLISTGAIAS